MTAESSLNARELAEESTVRLVNRTSSQMSTRLRDRSSSWRWTSYGRSVAVPVVAVVVVGAAELARARRQTSAATSEAAGTYRRCGQRRGGCPEREDGGTGRTAVMTDTSGADRYALHDEVEHTRADLGDAVIVRLIDRRRS